VKPRKSLLLILLACSSLLILVGPRPGRAQPLSPHAPIFITSVGGFENFTSAAGVTSGGTGHFDNPYVIENWEITANTTAAIHIKNTQSFFVIRNVFIHPASLTPESSGIYLDSAMNGRVENVRISNFTYGLWLSLGSTSRIITNSMWNNTYGIYVTGSDNIVSDNHLYNNTKYGIWITSSTTNVFTGNNASNNGNLVDGAGFFINGSNNLFENNTVTGNSWFGFKMVGSLSAASSNNVFKNNKVSNDGTNPFTAGGGIVFADNCSRNLVIGNTVTDNVNAIGLEGGLEVGNSYNNLTLNRVTNNTFGIYLVASFQNLVYNNYLNNTTNAFDNTFLNHWNTTERLASNIIGGPMVGGNFYSDYQDPDPDGDGIGDTPYNIAGTPSGQKSPQDQLPLVKGTFSIVTNVAASTVTAQPSSLKAGGTFTITATAWNKGTISESFTLSVYVNGTFISSQQVIDLSALSSIQLTFPWNTGGVPPGTYRITPLASTVSGETYTADNTSPPAYVSVLLNLPPVASFTLPASALAGKEVSLDASSSLDPDGTITSYSWDFGDETTGTAATPSHSYAKAGNYTITLTVTDNNGSPSSPTTKTLTVESSQPGSPASFQLTATSGKTTLTWSPPSSTGGSTIIRYRIYRATSSSQPMMWLANTTDTSYVDTTVSNGQTYYYKVTAVNGAGMESPIENSIQKDVLVPSGISNPPNNLPGWLAVAAAVISAGALGAVVIRRRIKPGPRIA